VWETAASRLSPTSSRVAARKTLNSSFAEEEEVDELATSQPKSKGKGRALKGKEKASTSTRPYQEPKFELPAGAALVGLFTLFIAFVLIPYLQVNRPCDRCCSSYLTPFRCYVVAGSPKCVKCEHDKQGCSFESEAQLTSALVMSSSIPKAKTRAPSTSRVKTPRTPVASGSHILRWPLFRKSSPGIALSV